MSGTQPPAMRACCEMHGRHCEPPSELCCDGCSEVDHPQHPPGVNRVIDPAAVAAAQRAATAGLAELRDRIADALRDRINQAPQRPTLDGPTGLSEIAVGMTELADAVLALVQPELDRLHDAEDRLCQIAGAADRASTRADEAERDRHRWRTRAERAEAAVERVRELIDEALLAWKAEHEHYQDRASAKGYSHDETAAETYGLAIEVVTEIRVALDQPAKEGE